MDEALDLAATLPDGSLTVSALAPARSWERQREDAAAVVDAIWAAAFWLAGGRTPAEASEQAPSVVRPRDRAAAEAAARRAASVRDRIENTRWEAVDG